MEVIDNLETNIPFFIPLCVFIFGAIWGSFLNVCIYRIPEERSIISPPSSCQCGKRIPFYLNLGRLEQTIFFSSYWFVSARIITSMIQLEIVGSVLSKRKKIHRWTLYDLRFHVLCIEIFFFIYHSSLFHPEYYPCKLFYHGADRGELFILIHIRLIVSQIFRHQFIHFSGSLYFFILILTVYSPPIMVHT